MPRNESIIIIICSDGFWELIDEDKIVDILRNSSNAGTALDGMVGIVDEM